MGMAAKSRKLCRPRSTPCWVGVTINQLTIRLSALMGCLRIAEGIALGADGSGAWIGLGAAGTPHPAAFGQSLPGGSPTRPDGRRRQDIPPSYGVKPACLVLPSPGLQQPEPGTRP